MKVGENDLHGMVRSGFVFVPRDQCERCGIWMGYRIWRSITLDEFWVYDNYCKCGAGRHRKVETSEVLEWLNARGEDEPTY